MESGRVTELELEVRILNFVNATLLQANGNGRVSAETLLFEDRHLDSIRVLDLIAFVERETGRTLPDSAIRLANFGTARAIARTALDPRGYRRGQSERVWSHARRARRSASAIAGGPFEAPATASATATVVAFDERTPGVIAPRDEMRALMDQVDRVVVAWAQELGAEDLEPHPLIPLSTLERAGYVESFPGRAIIANDGARLEGATSPPLGGQAIPPAACLHCYERFADRLLERRPWIMTLATHCARGDESLDAVHGRLREFTMREIVIVGTANDVDRLRREMMRRVQAYVTSLDLAGWIEVASDHFHTSSTRGKQVLQRVRALKYELRVPIGSRSVAIASLNHHEDYFGRAFGIGLPDGTLANTGCVAFGLERWALAMLADHAPDAWQGPRDE